MNPVGTYRYGDGHLRLPPMESELGRLQALFRKQLVPYGIRLDTFSLLMEEDRLYEEPSWKGGKRCFKAFAGEGPASSANASVAKLGIREKFKISCRKTLAGSSPAGRTIGEVAEFGRLRQFAKLVAFTGPQVRILSSPHLVMLNTSTWC